jgi:hypothetical protein
VEMSEAGAAPATSDVPGEAALEMLRRSLERE